MSHRKTEMNITLLFWFCWAIAILIYQCWEFLLVGLAVRPVVWSNPNIVWVKYYYYSSAFCEDDCMYLYDANLFVSLSLSSTYIAYDSTCAWLSVVAIYFTLFEIFCCQCILLSLCLSSFSAGDGYCMLSVVIICLKQDLVGIMFLLF